VVLAVSARDIGRDRNGGFSGVAGLAGVSCLLLLLLLYYGHD